MRNVIESLELGDEIIHLGQLGIYWGKFDKSSYNQTAYHKKLLKAPFYPLITIRNARTFQKLVSFKNEIKLRRINMSLLEKIRVTQAFLESKELKNLSLV